MNGGGGGSGGEPVTRIVLHWQRCTVAPEAGGGHGGEGGGQPDAENGRAPPVAAAAADRPTDRGTSAKNEGLVGGRAMDVILACLPPTRPPTSPILLPTFLRSSLSFFFRSFSSPFSSSSSSPRSLSPRLPSLRGLSRGAGPLAAFATTERAATLLGIFQSCNALWTHAPTRAVNLLIRDMRNMNERGV